LGLSLIDRDAGTRNLADLDDGIAAYRQAIKRTPRGSPLLPGRLSNLGSGLQHRYKHTGKPADLHDAIDAYRQSCQQGLSVSVEDALRSSHNWGMWALERTAWDEAVQAYGFGLEAVERLIRIQLMRGSKETWMHKAIGLHGHAAYALARSGDLPGAVVALERGNARLLTEALQRNQADLQTLNGTNPELVTRYRQATDHLCALRGQEMRETDTSQSLVAELRKTYREFDALITEIRHVEGYQDFLKSADFAMVQTAAAHAPLVYMDLMPEGGMLLVVHGDGTITPVWLAERTDLQLVKVFIGEGEVSREESYLGAYERWRDDPEDPAALSAWLRALERTTHWLWEGLMAPLEQVLADSGVERAVLIPQGLLVFLPLHAAWTDDPHAPTGRRYALDAIQFAYAPNAQALLACQRRVAAIPPETVFAVDNPDGSLDFSDEEVMGALMHFPPGRKKVLGGKAASLARVLEQLPRANVLHFATHGVAGFADPLESSLLMAHDEWLTLRDILSLRLEKTRLTV
ncbi:CHAT domain-containing protein, partial [bacterium]|nr:CHAT domain-containing protein [bacterium]